MNSPQGGGEKWIHMNIISFRWASGCTREELPGTVQRPTCRVQIPARLTKKIESCAKWLSFIMQRT
jgi:hypothetical protein